MIDLTYIHETIEILERSVPEEALLEEDDYQEICLRILKCEAIVSHNKPLSKIIDTNLNLKWFAELTDLFYQKMKIDMESLEDED